MRYTGPRGKKARRLGQAFTTKEAKVLRRRQTPPGQHTDPRGRLSEVGLQLKEKQKAKFAYGVQEKQFYRYFLKAKKQTGLVGANLLRLLESRLDNVVYRLGLAESRAQARQLVSHGFFQVNGRKVNIPSFAVKAGDVVRLADRKRNSGYVVALKEKLKAAEVLDWLDLSPGDISAKVLGVPSTEEMEKLVNTQLIIEHYSRI